MQLMMDCGDDILIKHFKSMAYNATYISPLSQNALIEAAGTFSLRKIILQVQGARYLTLLADETTDFSRTEQLSV